MYDLLCYSFFYGAFLYYVRIRQSGDSLTRRQIIACSALYICALNSKEMAVTLPIFVAGYELLYHPLAAVIERMRTAAILTAITLVYVVGKTAGPDRITANAAYRPSVTTGHYLDAFQWYAARLFYYEEWFDPWKGLALLLVLLAIAWVGKARTWRSVGDHCVVFSRVGIHLVLLGALCLLPDVWLVASGWAVLVSLADCGSCVCARGCAPCCVCACV